MNESLLELINKIRGNSPFNFLKSFFVPAKVNTRSKEKVLIPSVCTRTKLCQRSLKISVLQLNKWLKENSLLPESIGKMSKASCAALIEKMNCNCITNNRDLHNLFYYVKLLKYLLRIYFVGSQGGSIGRVEKLISVHVDCNITFVILDLTKSI